MAVWSMWHALAALFLVLGQPALCRECNSTAHVLVGTPPACLPLFLQQGAKLQPAIDPPDASSRFGTGVALSKSGSILVVSGYIKEVGSRAAIYTFTRKNETWTQQGIALLLPQSQVSKHTIPVALSGDGSTLAVGLPGMTPTPGKNDSSVLVFRRSKSGTWKQEDPLLRMGSHSKHDRFGAAVALSEDGKWLAVGAPAFRGSEGATWVYVRNGTTWLSASNRLVDRNISRGRQGFAVALSADGSTLAVGAPNAQAAQIYTRSAQGVYKRKAGVMQPDYGFGTSVDLSGDGGTLAVGSTGQSAFVYVTASRWERYGNAQAVVPALRRFGEIIGSSVSISSNGKVLALGAGSNNPSDTSETLKGAYVFVYKDGKWLQLGSKIVVGRNAPTREAAIVQLSGSGRVLAVAGPWDRLSQGSVWMFGRGV